MLPKIAHPVFELTLPISKQVVKFRPFRVKEQAILLTAVESDEKFIVDNVINVLKNCCINDVNIDELSTIDIEYFIIQLRAKSVSEIIEKNYVCKNIVDGEYCNNKLNIDVELTDIKLSVSDYNDIIMITDSIGLKMKYPDKALLKSEVKFNSDITDEMILACIDYVFDDDNVYKLKEESKEEINNFFDSFSIKNYEDIKAFFQVLPTLRKDISFACNKCGYRHNITLEGLQDFFD